MAFKLTPAQATALRAIRAAGAAGAPVKGRTRTALQGVFAIVPSPHGDGTYTLTPTGGTYLDEHERRERAAQESAERLSRPVPAQIGEPSAARPLVLDTDMGNGCDCDRDGCPVCFPESTPEPVPAERVEGAKSTPEPLQVGRGDNGKGAVPQAWIDQLVTLLDADARIVKTDQGWRVDRSGGGAGRAFLYQWDRLDAAAREAIRRGIAEALPATPGQGVVRLQLTDAFRERRAADRGVRLDAVVRYGKRRMEVARIEQGMARCFPIETMDNAPAQWIELESLEPVSN